MNWIYNGVEITDVNDPIVPIGAIGFIYKITKYKIVPGHPYRIGGESIEVSPMAIPDKIYIGKKLLTNATKKHVGVRAQAKQLIETGDKRKIKKVIRGSKVSNWQTYWGSCKELCEDHKNNPELFRREILEFAFGKKHLSYLETKYQFLHNVLETDSYNNHIQNWYKKDIINDNNKETN